MSEEHEIAEFEQRIKSNKAQVEATCKSLLDIVLVACAHGFVMTYLWRWFVMPATGIVRPISIAEGIGLVITARFATMITRGDEPTSRPLLLRLLVPLFIWFMAFVVQLWT